MILFPILAAVAFQPSAGMLRQLFEQELERRNADYGDADPRTAAAARDLGLFLAKQGDRQAAIQALTRALRVDEKAFGPAAPRTLADAAELAAVSQVEQAEPLWLRASRSPDAAVAARSFAALGELRRENGDRAAAAMFFRQALAKEESASGKAGRGIAARLNALSLVVDAHEGIPLLDRALRLTIARLGAKRVESASIEMNLASLLLNVGQHSRAAKLAKDSASVFEELLGNDHPRTAAAIAVYAHALGAAGDKRAAETMFRRALLIDEQVLGPQHPQTLAHSRMLSDFLRGVSGSEGK